MVNKLEDTTELLTMTPGELARQKWIEKRERLESLRKAAINVEQATALAVTAENKATDAKSKATKANEEATKADEVFILALLELESAKDAEWEAMGMIGPRTSN